MKNKMQVDINLYKDANSVIIQPQELPPLADEKMLTINIVFKGSDAGNVYDALYRDAEIEGAVVLEEFAAAVLESMHPERYARYEDMALQNLN